MSNTLQSGINSLRAGNKSEARRLLLQAVRENPADEQAWLWLSGAVETARERLYCLERVLAINPNNEAARLGKARLLQSEQTAPACEPQQSQTRLAVDASPHPLSISRSYEQASRMPRQPKANKKSITISVPKRTAIVIATIVVAIVCCLGGLALATASGILEQLPAIWVTAAPTPQNTALPRPTSPPTWTPRPSPTPTADPCTIENPATRQYLATCLEVLDEEGQAFECASKNGAIGPAIAPCVEQLREVRGDFYGLWYPTCATTHRRALLAFLDEAVYVLEAARDRNEEAFDAHLAKLEERASAAQRESDRLEQLLREASQ